ncbi:MAG: oxidoreductase [Betaproteobacteria bacterium]|nr:oxidoreductase [Betaproteobacteria bacterium]
MSADRATLPYGLDVNRRLDRWVRIGGDGTVMVYTGKVEIGQGIVSAMAQMAAEELDVSYSRIRMVALDTTMSPDEGATSGSRSVEEGGTALRYACAEVRDLFLQAACGTLGVTLERVSVDDGTIRVRDGAASVTYWDLASAVDLAREATGEVRPKSAAELKIVGTSLPRLDIAGKVTGAAYVHDIDLPGMLHGRVVRPPSYRAQLVSIDLEAAKARSGVRAVVRRGSFVGVVAEREEQAIRAMRALAAGAQWDERADLPDVDALPEFLLSQPSEEEALSDQRAASAPAVQTLEARYTRPYLAHASIAPSCAIAKWTGGGLEVWTHSQACYPLRDELAKILKLLPTDIVVRHAEGAGCYGHNGADDAVLDAVLLAQAAGDAPVRVQWMREDEFAWEPFGPAMVVNVQASLDAQGRIVDWREDVHGNRHISRPGRHSSPGLLAAWHWDEGFEPPPAVDMPLAAGGGSQRNAVPLYDFPNQRVTNHAVIPMPVRASTLRALGAYANVFAIESFMDELALAAGVDPVEFRLRHLSDARARAVIEAAAEKAGWSTKSQRTGEATSDVSSGIAIGFARYKNAGDYVAVVAEVDVAETVRVRRVVTAIDCGRVVNPDGIRKQAEGGVIQATSWTLKEQVRFDRTRITTRNWDDYPILAFTEAPDVETVLIDRPDEPSLGVGEGMAGPTAAAIANAVYDALGVRVRDLPITRERILAAMNT